MVEEEHVVMWFMMHPNGDITSVVEEQADIDVFCCLSNGLHIISRGTLNEPTDR